MELMGENQSCSLLADHLLLLLSLNLHNACYMEEREREPLDFWLDRVQLADVH